MSNRKRVIVNKSDLRSGLKIGFVVRSQGRTVAEKNSLRSGEKAEFQPGDVLVLISEKRANYAVQTGSGTLLFAWQVTNNHPDYPDHTVTAYKMRYLDEAGRETSAGSDSDDSGADDIQTRDDDGSNGDIIVTEPNEPEP